MIAGFGNEGTEDIWAGEDTKAARRTLPTGLWPKTQELLDQLDAAAAVRDLGLPPSNRLHKLKGKMKAFWSVSINMKFRIIFKFANGQASDVGIIDYH